MINAQFARCVALSERTVLEQQIYASCPCNCSLEELLFALANKAFRRTRSLYIQNGGGCTREDGGKSFGLNPSDTPTVRYFVSLSATPRWLRPARARSGSQYLLSSRQKAVVLLEIPMLVAQLASCRMGMMV